jgi:lysophospholipase L1-like esterase
MNSFLSSLLVVAALAAAALTLRADPVTIMPLGDSLTAGVGSANGSGYRYPLYEDLLHDPNFPGGSASFQFIGSTTSGTDSTGTLAAAGDAHHNGYGHYQIMDINDNLNGDVQPVAADDNEGGYWLPPDAPVKPSYVLLMIGANDFLQQNYTDIDQNLTTLVEHIHMLSPTSEILIAGTIPIDGNMADPYGDRGMSAGYYPLVLDYDNFIENTLVKELPYTGYVDQVDNFLNPDGTINSSLYSADGIHPNDTGYAAIANTWDEAIDAQIDAVPEPSTWALFGAGSLALLAWTGVRRKRANQAV